MNLLEVDGKRLFLEYGIPVPMGFLSKGALTFLPFGFPAVVKAQILSGGRGKAGGIRVVNDWTEMQKAVNDIVGMEISGHKVEEVLIERKVETAKELYVSITVDRSKRMPLVMASGSGGMDIENVADDKIFKEWVDPLIGLQPYILRSLINRLGLGTDSSGQFTALLQGMWRLFQDMDAEMVEINPVIMTPDGKFVAADSKVVIDDDSLFRHEELKASTGEKTDLERMASALGVALVTLDGDIGVIANGAGLTMATLDLLESNGGRGGVFLDLGGTDDPDKVRKALLLMVEAKPKAILINIFGGITKCDTVAEGLIGAMQESRFDIPIVARIKGVNEEKAVEMLAASSIVPKLSLEEAIKSVVKVASGGGRDVDND